MFSCLICYEIKAYTCLARFTAAILFRINDNIPIAVSDAVEQFIIALPPSAVAGCWDWLLADSVWETLAIGIQCFKYPLQVIQESEHTDFYIIPWPLPCLQLPIIYHY